MSKDRRSGDRAIGRSVLVAFGLVIAGSPVRLAAQVGHAPGASPFRDVNTRQSLTFFAGHFNGNVAEAGTGASGGPIFGVRVRARLSGPIDLMATVARIGAERMVIDPSQPVGSRLSGPVPLDMIAADLGLLFSLTGAKTWRGFAPYLGAGLGVVSATDSRVDPGGYRVKTNFTIVPTIGVRYHVGQRLALQLEARDNTIRYEWPRAYFFPVDANNNALPAVLSPADFDDRDVTHNRTLSVGISYLFNF
jgi:hypothetical protein